jgi:Transposase DDE domain
MRSPSCTRAKARAQANARAHARRSTFVHKLKELLAQPPFEAIPIEIVPHCAAVPLGVMVRGVMESLLDTEALEKLLQEYAPEQYTLELTMDALVGLLVQVAAGHRATVFAAYTADQALTTPTIPTSYQAVYGKLGRTDPNLSEAIVRFCDEKLRAVLKKLQRADGPVLAGYRTRILDGNVLTGTDHRLGALRRWLNACLPGKSLVILEPDLGLISDLVLCEDAYTQERALVGHILERVRPKDLLVFDRNFTTTGFAFGIVERGGSFVGRQHKTNLPVTPVSKLVKRGETETGKIYEQIVRATDPNTGATLLLRRIELRLFEKTRDGEKIIGLLTNLPETVEAVAIAEIYRKRWRIETQFQLLTVSLHCEVPGLGKPKAALFAFAMSLVASNALAVVRASLRAAHGKEAEAEVSGYYLADEISAQYRTLAKYLPAETWTGWRTLGATEMARLLTEIARQVNMAELLRNQRGPKKPPENKPVYNRKHQHFSTYRLIEEAEDSC